ncbi:MAG TPA: potassium-transporting ATPase subunit KdpC [Humidesulfovibrio sp.]|nr:potassium-transporting ATPase subunit KdpC [Humidesulfovibrio sp.]HWR05011.1 potassium-transporting ATPase subunit KdpC [Humidesulfovibrio sp.]
MNTLRPACLMLLALSLVTGLAYPALVTGIAQALFPRQANGSLIVENGTVAGSALIGQQFSGPGSFWSRPSATSPQPYNAAASGGSNLGPTNPAQLKNVAERAEALRKAHGDGPVPPELVTASASGLDPHLSPSAALYQAERVARERGLDEAAVRQLIDRRTEARQLGLLGEERVNVLLLNRDLDSLAAKAQNISRP